MGFLDYDGLLYFWQQIKTKFAAASHKHVIADVDGLQAALDAKASTGTATTDAAGLMSAADKAKLDGIAEGADKSDAYTKAEVDERLTGYLKSADAEATYAPASDVSALGTRMDDAESSIAHLAGRLPIYYYTDVPSESSITEKPQLAVIKGGAVYLFE